MNQDGGGGDVGNILVSDLVFLLEEIVFIEFFKELIVLVLEFLILYDYIIQFVSQEQLV